MNRRKPMPAGAEAIRAERAARQTEVGAPPPANDTRQGGAVIRSAWIGTAVFAAVTVLGAVVAAARIPAVIVDLVLFLVGSGLFLWGLVLAARRSREKDISLWNLILLEDIAPRRVRARLLGATGVQVAVAAGTCWITPALAFGWLVPVWGIAHSQLWGAAYGAFRSRR